MDAIRNWKLERLNTKSENTINAYQIHLRRYLDYRKVTADEMAKWDEKNATHELLIYMGYLSQQNKAPQTMALSWNALKSFFRSTGIKIDERAPVRIKERKYRDMVFTKSQIKKTLDFAPLQVKLGISLMAFSGLSPSDAVRLTYGHFKYDLDRNITPVMLTIKRKKTGQDYVTFVPEQTIRYLKEWIEYRQRDKKSKNKKVIKGEVIKDETPIFRWSNSSYMIKKQTEYIRKETIEPRNGFRIRNYCFRKYYRQQLTGKLPEFLIEFSMGHDTQLMGIYSGIVDLDEGAVKAMRDEFAEALPPITTEGGIPTAEMDEVKEKVSMLEDENKQLKSLREENQMLKQQMDSDNQQLKEKDKETQERRKEKDKEMQELRKQMDDLTKIVQEQGNHMLQRARKKEIQRAKKLSEK